MPNPTLILAIFDETGATVLRIDDTGCRVLVHVAQLGEWGVQIFARLIEALFANPAELRTLVLVGADPTSTTRKLQLPAGTPVIRLPPWSVLGRFLRNAAPQLPDGERRPIPPRL